MYLVELGSDNTQGMSNDKFGVNNKPKHYALAFCKVITQTE